MLDAPNVIREPAYEMLIAMLKGVLNEENDKGEESKQLRELHRLKTGKSLVGGDAPIKDKKPILSKNSKSVNEGKQTSNKTTSKKNSVKRKYYTIPLEILDPLNKKYLGSSEYTNLRTWYGMKSIVSKYQDDDEENDENDEDLFKKFETRKDTATPVHVAKNTNSREPAILQANPEILKAKRKEKQRAGRIAKKTCNLDLIPLMRRILSRDIDKGKKLLKLAEKNFSLLDSFLEKEKPSESEMDPSDLNVLLGIDHALNVDMTLLPAHVRPELQSLIHRCEDTLGRVIEHCQDLRASISEDIQQQSFAEWDVKNVSITSLTMWKMFQTIRAEARSKERLVYDNFKKKYETREKRMAKNSTMLFRLTSFLMKVILRFAPIFATKDSAIKVEDGYAGVLWLEKTLTLISHRGLRYSFREAITHTIGLGVEFFGREKCSTITTSIGNKILVKQATPLRKRLSDVAFMLGCLLPNISDTKIRQKLVKELIKLWSNPDGEVASEAINAILRLGRMKLQEVLDIATARRGSSKLMTQITKVKSNLGAYPDSRVRDGLETLQNWCQSLMIRNRQELLSKQ